MQMQVRMQPEGREVVQGQSEPWLPLLVHQLQTLLLLLLLLLLLHQQNHLRILLLQP